MASIYKITSPSYPGKCYIGSTIYPLNKRLERHYRDFKTNHTYCTSFILLDRNDAVMELLEMCPVENRNEREQIHIDANDCVNVNDPCSTPERKKEKKNISRRNWRKLRRVSCMICDIECDYDCYKRHFQRFHTAK